MAYATIDHITDAAGGAAALVQLFDWDADGIADAAVIARHQTAVETWLDTYLGTRFGVPLTDPSGAFARLVAEEVVFRGRSDRQVVTADHVKLHDDRVKWVRDLAAGRAVPSDPQPPKATSARSEWVSRDGDCVSRERMKGAW